MLKNHELIFRMSLHQRIRLITSAKPDENCAVDSYEFPLFHFYSNPSKKSTDAFATFFPSDKALAATFDSDIIRNVYECTGNEAKANKPYAYFNITDNAKREGISEDDFLTVNFLKRKAEGIKNSGAHLNFDDCPATDNEVILNETAKYIADGLLFESVAHSFRAYSVPSAEELKKSHRYNGLVFGVASEKDEVAKYISSGATLVFVNRETAEGLEDYLVELCDKHVKAKEELDAGTIDLAEFDRRIRGGEILDAEAVNAACDRMISLLLDLKESGPSSVEEQRVRIGKASRDPLFNEPYHDKLARHAAQQSVVLIKNQNKILPLKKDIPVAVIGEYATNNDYRIKGENKPTALHRPFDEINNYKNINAVGYAHGYCAGESKRLDLIETALNLCDEAKCAIVYLCAAEGATSLPAGQKELLDALSRKGVKIIAVVSAERAIDLSFADQCEAVLFSYDAGQGCAQAVFDIISGEISPSGKLVDTFFKDFSSVSEEEGVPFYCSVGASNVLYPFGYGLSFTEFEYKNLKITEKGASCTVTNKGRYDGYATLLLFVQRAGAHTSFAHRIVRGFKKVFVKKGDSEKIEIPFDDDTFKVYDKANDRQFVQGGKYEISLCENAHTIVLRSEFDVKEKTFTDKIANTPVKNTGGLVGFTDTQLDRAIRREKKKLSFGLKLFIAIMLTVYYDAMCAGLMFSGLIAEKTTVLYAVLGVLLAIGNILAVIYIVIICKRRKLQSYLHPNEVLTDMVYKVKEFDEVAKVVYTKPVEKPVIEFNPPDEEEEEEEEIVRHYDATFAEEEEEVAFSPKVSFNELCNAFRTFCANRGVNVELSSVRSFLAGLASGKLVFLSCKNKEVLPALTDAVCEYFSVAGRIKASDEWNSIEDLLWRRGESAGDYVLSDVSNAINLASKTPEKNSFILIENVSMLNVAEYFSKFLDYANFPSEEHFIDLNGEVSLKIPSNLCFILIPSADSFAEEFTPALAHAGMLIDMVVSKGAPQSGEGEDDIKVISRFALEELITEAKEKYFVNETVWKKLDEFTEAVNATEKFSIDNKSLLQLEKYSSILLECGGDESEVLVNMFTAKIIPLLKVCKAYKKEKGGLILYEMIEKLFGEENLNAVQRALVSNV